MLVRVGGVDQILPAAMAAYRRRLLRQHFFPDIFGEPAWDMLLLLGGEGPQPVSALSVAGGTPATTGLRWIARLQRAGLIERIDDPEDRRRRWMRLSSAGRAALTGYFGRVENGVASVTGPRDALMEIMRIATSALDLARATRT